MARVALIGTSTPIQRLLARLERSANLDLVALYTELESSGEVLRLAAHSGIPVRPIRALGDATAAAELIRLQVDWLLCLNSTVILPEPVISAPRMGALNLHPGPLPEYAGLHPHQWAIRNGEKEYRVTLHHMTERIDAGPIALTASVPLNPTDTGLSLFARAANVAAELAQRALHEIAAGRPLPSVAQDLSRRRCYRHAMSLDGRFAWDWPTARIWNHLRAADYRPFRSPTYVPEFQLHHEPVRVRAAKLGELESVAAGEIVTFHEQDAWIGAADAGTICLSLLEWRGEQLTARELCARMTLQVGDRLSWA